MPHPKWYKDKTEKQREYRKRRKAREQKARLEEYERIKQQYAKELSIEPKNETVIALENISKFLREQNNNIIDTNKAREIMSEEELIKNSESIMEYWTCSHCGSSVPIYYEYCHNCYDIFRRLESRPYERDSDAELFLRMYPEFKKYIRDRKKPIVSEDMI